MIDKPTIARIMDATNIVDVVSEFVSLKKRGVNYIGLCPFHNDSHPSFSVSPARGICHCFTCGKGGNAINFLMELEQMTYPDALRWLANKYHIEIKERELTSEEKEKESERESMFIVNEWASKYFEDILQNDVDGRAIGMQYFRSRGFRDDIIRKFRLGFDPNSRTALYDEAIKKGYNAKYLVATGLCFKVDKDEASNKSGEDKYLDRFSGRAIFPWFSVSGKVVAFGGRVLDSRTKGVNQKYVNSPDSDIYHKERELYGLYQAKKAIAKENCVYMVEGYTDVISMHQCGIENVVANSGTALSVHQIRLLHRFTNNIVLLYDGDAAGVHAALRGTDMLLEEEMNVKVLLLPDGNDPDSFARSHTASDFRKYIEENQTDFIQFKTHLMLKGVTDPVKRSEAINSIVRSISLVQDQILRDTYLHECAMRMSMNEATLINTMNKFIRDGRDRMNPQQQQAGQQTSPEPPRANAPQQLTVATPLQQASKVERMLVKMVIRNGNDVIYRNVEDADGNLINLNVAQYLAYNLSIDGLHLENPTFERILNEAVAHSADEGFQAEQFFIHHEDIEISKIATSLTAERYQLSPTALAADAPMNEQDRLAREATRIDNVRNQLEHLLNDFRMDYIEHHLKELQQKIKTATNGPADELMKLMAEYKETQELRNKLARMLGNNIVV